MLGLFIEGNCKQGELGVPQKTKLENIIRAEKFAVATLVMGKQRVISTDIVPIIPKSLDVCFQSPNVFLYTFLSSCVFS